MGTPVIQYTMVAPCGCKYAGRFYSTADCTVLDPNPTGRQIIRHAMRAKKDAVSGDYRG